MRKGNTAHVFSWERRQRTAESHYMKPKVIKDLIVIRAFTQAVRPCISARARLKSGVRKTLTSARKYGSEAGAAG